MVSIFSYIAPPPLAYIGYSTSLNAPSPLAYIGYSTSSNALPPLAYIGYSTPSCYTPYFALSFPSLFTSNASLLYINGLP